jgi:hypothetical protein
VSSDVTSKVSTPLVFFTSTSALERHANPSAKYCPVFAKISVASVTPKFYITHINLMTEQRVLLFKVE